MTPDELRKRAEEILSMVAFKSADNADFNSALELMLAFAAEARREAIGESVRVPNEATIEMALAAMSMHRKWESGELSGNYWKAIYKAMIDARVIT